MKKKKIIMQIQIIMKMYSVSFTIHHIVDKKLPNSQLTNRLHKLYSHFREIISPFHANIIK